MDYIQSTLLIQYNGFSPVARNGRHLYTTANVAQSFILPFSLAAIQIHFTPKAHWVTSTYFGQQVQLYDSLVGNTLPSSWKSRCPSQILLSGSKEW